MSAKFHRYLAAIFFLGALGLASPAFAQFETATVLGTVHDPVGAAVPGARITLRNVATGVTAHAESDLSGNYQFLNVKIGTYEVTGELSGFSKAVARDVTVSVNARQRVDLALQTGAITEEVTVEAQARMLETDSSDRGQVINRQQIVNLPLNGRAYADLALLSPGVRKSVLNTQESGGRDASFNVNGLRSSLNSFMLDGVDNNFYGTSNQGFSNQVVQASPDAVQEFRVQTNNFSAEYGRAGGAVINASIRSGTNEFRGSAYDFLRDTSLNAVGFFKPTRLQKPELQQNQFGATFGGPIVKDRTFFFANYEGFRRTTKSLQFGTIANASERGGVLGVPVRIPYDFVDSSGTLQRAGTVIPAGSPVPMTSFARQVLGQLPPVTTAAASNNFENLPRSTFFNDKFDVKVDHNFNSRVNAFARVSYRKLHNFEAPLLPEPLFSPANADVNVENRQLATGVTWTLSGSSVLEVRLGVSHTKAGKTPTGLGGPSMLQGYGITGLPEDAGSTGGLNTQSIGGYTQMGRQNSNPQHQDPFVFNPRINYTRILGNHAAKAGYEFQLINTAIEDFHPKYGEDQYSGQFSRPAGAASANIYNLADFFFGARGTYNLNNVALLELPPTDAFRLRAGRLEGQSQADPEPRPALRVRHAPVREGQPPRELRSGHQHPRPGPGRLAVRPLGRASGPQQLRAPHRRRLSAHAADGGPRRVRDQLRPFQPPGRREHARLQRPLHRGRQRGPAGLPAPLHGERVPQLLPPDAGRLSARPDDVRELQPAGRARELHAGRHPHRLRAELAPDRAA